MKIGFWIFGVAFFVLFCCVQSTVFAVSDTDLFRVRAFVGDDTTPPTTPEFTSVVPVTSQQINVEWSASTDDVLLIAYRLYRDGEQIATTSQTSFNDTGLTPETLYTYTVDAYDSFDNVSSTSVPVATTTLAIPVVPTSTPTTTRTQTSTLVTRLDSFSVTPEQRSALFRFQTNTNTRYTLSWGRTTSYELGTISTNIFK
jgi:chitodextrinase